MLRVNFIFGWVFLLLVGCQTKPPKSSQTGPYPDVQSPTEQLTDPEPQSVPRPRRIGIVLGGAGIASFASVGVLKSFEEENIKPTFIVATGWPSLFALAYGYLGSIHDTEWFALRLGRELFYSGGLFDFKKGFQGHSPVAELANQYFKQTDLAQTRVPVYLATSQLNRLETQVTSRGPWKDALSKSMAVPGIHRPATPQQHILSYEGLNVEFAKTLEVDAILVVDMYSDYLRNLTQGDIKNTEEVFRNTFATFFRKSLRDNLAKSPYRLRVILNKPPNDFASKRAAIEQGYDLGKKFLQSFRVLSQ